jgi:hypothetical protein
MFDWPERWRVAVLTVAAVLSAAAEYRLLRPIPQSPLYHQFADRRAALGVPNFADVSTNLLFLAVGAYGLLVVGRDTGLMPAATASPVGAPGSARAAYAAFFAGVVLTCFGSAYYHWSPDNGRLVWDRLPMSGGFMGLLAATVRERVSARLGDALLAPLLALGAASVLAWAWSESRGRGDLRFYYAVQFLSLGLILLMVALFRSRSGGSAWLLASIGVYGAAKVCEANDRAIFDLLGVGGHTLKHGLAAGGIFLVARMLAGRAGRTGGPPATGPAPAPWVRPVGT